MNDCTFCHYKELPKAEFVHEYGGWILLLQPEKKRHLTKTAAGLLVSRRHMKEVSDANADELIELGGIIKDAARRLSVATGTTYVGNETVGFNQGSAAGQTIMHAHIHVLPSVEEDPEEMKVRGGIGGAFEALRRERLER